MESGEALMFDEACLVAVEINNQLNEEKNKITETQKKKDAAFQKDMDFTADDWEQINITVSAAAYELDIELLNSIMSVIVERKKI